MLNIGRIRKFTLSCALLIIFIPKHNPNNPFKLIVDYRSLNYITILIRYLIPLISEMQNRFREAKWFIKINLKAGFNLVRIKKGDKWKITFRCKYGLFKYTVIPFGFINAFAIF